MLSKIPIYYDNRTDLQRIDADEIIKALRPLVPVPLEGFDLIYDNQECGRYDKLFHLVIDPIEKRIVLC